MPTEEAYTHESNEERLQVEFLRKQIERREETKRKSPKKPFPKELEDEKLKEGGSKERNLANMTFDNFGKPLAVKLVNPGKFATTKREMEPNFNFRIVKQDSHRRTNIV